MAATPGSTAGVIMGAKHPLARRPTSTVQPQLSTAPRSAPAPNAAARGENTASVRLGSKQPCKAARPHIRHGKQGGAGM